MKNQDFPILRFTLFLLMYLTLPLAATAQVVDIPDWKLKNAIRDALRKEWGDITVDDMATLTYLDARGRGIRNLTGLEHAINLSVLDLGPRYGYDNNAVSDFSPLTGLTKLTELDLGDNEISDISTLAGLTDLKELDLGNNSISDISTLAGLTKLTELNLERNRISDILPLAGLTNLTELDLERNRISDISPLVANTGLGDGDLVYLWRNPLNYLSIDTHIPTLQSKGVTVRFDEPVDIPDPNLQATIAETLGGGSDSPISVSDIATLSHLNVPNAEISNLTGLEFATGLEELNLSNNSISDISALSGLTDLTTLNLSNNSISDISALSGLTNLTTLNLSNNSISDISALAGLTNLDELDLSNNSISDLFPLVVNAEVGQIIVRQSPLQRGTFDDGSLRFPLEIEAGDNQFGRIIVRGNPLSDTSINTHIPVLRSKDVRGLGRTKLFLSANPPVAVGQTFTLNLTVNNVYDLAGWQLDISFNPAVLKAVSVNEGNFLLKDGGNTFFQAGEIDNAAGSITGISGAFIGTGGVTGSGTLLSINFEAKAAGEGGLRLSEDRLGASNGNQIHYEIVTHSVIVESTYDLNGDGEVNVLDLMLVAQNLGRANPQADANGDGTVDVFDLIVVAQHSEDAPQAPSSFARDGTVLNAEMVQNWIDMAHTANDGSLTFQLGIVNLERLLASMLPNKTALLANYPNPFNPETWIPYHLAHAADVTLTIYDIKGVVVRQFELGHQQAGYYTDKAKAVYWDGRNATGEAVSSGVYFYHLRVREYSATRRMLILK